MIRKRPDAGLVRQAGRAPRPPHRLLVTSSGLTRSSPTADLTPADRLAWRTLQLGAIAVPLAAATYKMFELDRFFLPKELAACTSPRRLCALLCLGRATAEPRARAASRVGFPLDDAPISPISASRAGLTWVDAAFVAYLLLSLASAFVGAEPVARGARARRSRCRARRCSGRRATSPAAASVTRSPPRWARRARSPPPRRCCRRTGSRRDFFSLNRAPGGTFGNRNFVAHLAAIGGPLLVYAMLRARHALGAAGATLGLVATTAALVLSRSRGAYLADGVVSAVPLAIGLWRAGKLPGARPGALRAVAARGRGRGRCGRCAARA